MDHTLCHVLLSRQEGGGVNSLCVFETTPKWKKGLGNFFLPMHLKLHSFLGTSPLLPLATTSCSILFFTSKWVTTRFEMNPTKTLNVRFYNTSSHRNNHNKYNKCRQLLKLYFPRQGWDGEEEGSRMQIKDNTSRQLSIFLFFTKLYQCHKPHHWQKPNV